jgi:hypothetical protein
MGSRLEYIVGKIMTRERRFGASFAIAVMTKLYYLSGEKIDFGRLLIDRAGSAA